MSQRWVSFDCYGTLIDWRAGMMAALRQINERRAQDLLEAYHGEEAEIERGPFQPYSTVLTVGTRRAGRALDIEIPTGDDDVLSRTLPEWPQFEDIGAALGRLVDGGYKLAILSNVDNDLIAGTLQRMPVTFDLVVTAEDVRSYKPQPAHFQRLLDATGVEPGCWAHVCCSEYHDVAPANDFGAATLWVDRDGTGDVSPGADVTLSDLALLAREVDSALGMQR